MEGLEPALRARGSASNDSNFAAARQNVRTYRSEAEGVLCYSNGLTREEVLQRKSLNNGPRALSQGICALERRQSLDGQLFDLGMQGGEVLARL